MEPLVVAAPTLRHTLAGDILDFLVSEGAPLLQGLHVFNSVVDSAKSHFTDSRGIHERSAPIDRHAYELCPRLRAAAMLPREETHVCHLDDCIPSPSSDKRSVTSGWRSVELEVKIQRQLLEAAW